MDDDWLRYFGIVLTESAAGTASLESAHLVEIAKILDEETDELMISARVLARTYGVSPSTLEIRSGAWRIDLPTGIVKAILSGAVTTTILRMLRADSVPLSVLAFIVPLIFEIRQVDLLPSDVMVHATLLVDADDQPHKLVELYELLPANIRERIGLPEFADVIERLLQARLAVVGANGLRLKAPRRTRGFRLFLSEGSSGKTRAATFHAESTDDLPTVFVSYAHESAQHKRDVLTFCELLAAARVEVRMDRWDLEERKDWQVWATRQILDSDFVVVVASPICRLVGDGGGRAGDNRGLHSEMRTLRELYHSETGNWMRRILPAVLPGRAVDEIPLFLQPHTADHFRIEELTPDGIEDLLRVIFKKPPFLRPPLGSSPDLPPA